MKNRFSYMRLIALGLVEKFNILQCLPRQLQARLSYSMNCIQQKVHFAVSMRHILGFLNQGLSWLNGPEQAGSCATGTLVPDGQFVISTDGSQLTMRAPSRKDFWSKTFYTPLLVKHDASGLLCTISDEEEATINIDFSFNPLSQFDQAGLLVYIDNEHWVKCGIEFCDGSPRLSVVVCNEYSDWSTQPWQDTAVSLKVHKVRQSDSIVVEAAPVGTQQFQFVRIAHLTVNGNPARVRQPWRVGPFAACPVEQKGCEVTFTNFSVGPREASVHSSEL